MDNLATAAESVVEEREMDNDVLEMNIDITSGDGEASGASNTTVDQRKSRMFYEPYQQESDSHQQYINSNVVIIVQFKIIPYFCI